MPTAALIAGGGLGAFGSVMGGLQEQRESVNEATQLQQQGQIQATRANAEIGANDTAAAEELGADRTVAGANGLTATSGSLRAVTSFNASKAILRDTYARYQGNLAEQNAYYQARSARYQGNQALAAGELGAGSTILTSALNYKALGGGLGLPKSSP